MKSLTCTVPLRRLARLATGGLREGARRRLTAHASACGSCRARLDRLKHRMDAMQRARLPAESSISRSVRIRAAVDTALAATVKSRPIRHPAAWALVAVSAAALLLWALRWRRSPSEVLILEGTVTSAAGVRNAGDGLLTADPRILEIVQDVELRLADGSRVRAPRGSSLELAPRGHGLRLLRGRTSVDAKPQPPSLPLWVETEEVTVRVVGTRFSVERASRAGRATSSVSVESGVVSVERRADGRQTTLAAGESAVFDAPGAKEVPPAARAVDVPAPAPWTGARRKGDANIEAAEALLAQGHYASAIRAYLRAARRSGGNEADAALFAAAQLALDHPDVGYDGGRLLRRYVARYPNGRFASDATRLLRLGSKQR